MMTIYIQTFVHDEHSAISTKEAFLQDFNSEAFASDLLENLEEMLPRTTGIFICIA